MVVDLPAPFGPEKSEHSARFHAEGQAVDGGEITVSSGELAGLDHLDRLRDIELFAASRLGLFTGVFKARFSRRQMG
jgi:hypothetical protein